MKSKRINALLLCGIILLPGCGNSLESKTASVAEESTEVIEAASDENPATAVAITDEPETPSEEATVASSVEAETENSQEFGPAEGLYDRTYVVYEDGVYTYRLSDPEIIKKYDELYYDAFQDVVDSYTEAVSWMNQRYEDKPAVTQSLVYKDQNTQGLINTGSNYEMDYNFDLNNIGYTYVDLDSDGTFELIFGIIKYEEWAPDYVFERAYALCDGKVVKFLEGGSRDSFSLGNDGYIYESGSGGAEHSGTWKLSFHSDELVAGDDIDWGNNGFTQEEFVGYWEATVHITSGPIEDMDLAAKLPESQITDEEFRQLFDEWESRSISIDWLRMTDYLEKYPLLGG